ncbi:MAG: hypothetical protein WBF42_17155, partial [Terracidiphilus sp.]
SILTLNKEIIDLLALSLFCYARRRKHLWILCLALVLAFFNRYEVSVAMIGLLVIRKGINPLRNHRWWTLAGIVALLSILLPLAAGHALEQRFEEASNARLVAVLDTLEMHYLFIVATIPKILEGMFGYLVNLSIWDQAGENDIANSYVLFFNNLAFAIVLALLIWKGKLRIESDWIYFAWLSAILMSVSLVIQPRYLYICYVLFCYEAALRTPAPVDVVYRSAPGGGDAQYAV